MCGLDLCSLALNRAVVKVDCARYEVNIRYAVKDQFQRGLPSEKVHRGFHQRPECYDLHYCLMGSRRVTLDKEQQLVQQISRLSKMANKIRAIRLPRHHPSSGPQKVWRFVLSAFHFYIQIVAGLSCYARIRDGLPLFGDPLYTKRAGHGHYQHAVLRWMPDVQIRRKGHGVSETLLGSSHAHDWAP